MYKISVIVPVYGVEDYIEDCLKSVAAQDYSGEVECLLIDDCGTDRSVEIASAFIAAYSGPVQFRLIHHQKNKGLSGARNTGMDNATGDYIFFLDSDDTITPDCLSKLAASLDADPGQGQSPMDIVVADLNVVGDASSPVKFLDLPDGTVFRGKPLFKKYSDAKVPLMACNKLYRFEFIKENSLKFKERLIHEDYLWSFQTYFSAGSMIVLTARTYNYLKRPESITTRKLNYRREAEHYLDIVCEMRKFVQERNLQEASSACNLIDAVVLIALSNARKDSRQTFKTVYRAVRTGDIYSRRLRARNNSESFLTFVKGLHFRLPVFLGAQLAGILSQRFS